MAKKILVFSDTHGHIHECIDVISKAENVCAVIHAGDVYDDAYDLQAVFDGIDFYCVKGNNDPFSPAPSDLTVKILSHAFFITHGHAYSVRSSRSVLAQRAKAAGAQIAIFGHTHKSCDTYEEGVHLINPGSMGFYPRSYASLSQNDDGTLKSEIIQY